MDGGGQGTIIKRERDLDPNPGQITKLPRNKTNFFKWPLRESDSLLRLRPLLLST